MLCPAHYSIIRKPLLVNCNPMLLLLWYFGAPLLSLPTFLQCRSVQVSPGITRSTFPKSFPTLSFRVNQPQGGHKLPKDDKKATVPSFLIWSWPFCGRKETKEKPNTLHEVDEFRWPFPVCFQRIFIRKISRFRHLRGGMRWQHIYCTIDLSLPPPKAP